MTNTVTLSDLDWIEFDRRLKEDDPPILLPIGSLEQHGPHSPNGSDEMLTRLIAEEVAGRVNGLVAPSISYGCRSVPRTGGGDHFPATTSISGRTLSFLVRDIIRELARHGVRRIVVLDTHFENEWFVIEGIDLAMREITMLGFTVPTILKVRYFELLSEEVIERVYPNGFPGWALEHAGVMTTSLHLYLTPELVDMSKAPDHGPIEFPPYDIFPYADRPGTETGCLNEPLSASAESGQLIFDEVVTGLCGVIAREFK